MARGTSAQSASKPHYVEVQPNAARTLLALREMGYDSYSAIMDLIDNSIDAGATRVRVQVREAGEDRVVEILDDGKGMDEGTLAEALRLGSNVEYEDARKRLGKFGMGLVTASISLARNIWIVTRQKGQPAYEATFDLPTIERENRFIITLKPAESRRVMDTVDERGTMVRLAQIDRINDRNVARFAATLRERLGQVYRHFLGEGFSITVNGRKVERYDPLMLDHPETTRLLETDINLGDGTRAHLIAVELPDLGAEGNAANNILPHNSGFYVVRNLREIIAAETFGFYRHHHSYTAFRAELRYHGDSTAFHEDVKKSSIHPDDRLREKLRELTEKLITDVGRRSRERAEGGAVVKLSHRSAAEIVNQKLSVLVGGPTRKLVEEAKAAAAKAPVLTPLPPAVVGEPAPRKRGRPTKEEQARRAAEEARRAAEEAKRPPAPSVEYTETDLGDRVRFFTATQEGPKLLITYNARHPFVRLVAEAKQPKVSQVMDLISFALAKAEIDVPEARKGIDRACDYLTILAAPLPGGAHE